MNYSSLQTDIATYLHRTDLTADIAGFIERAEAFLFRELVLTDLETSASGTTSGGVITLPADFGNVRRLTVTSYGIERNLDYKSPHDNNTCQGDAPASYSFEGGALRLFPDAGTGYPYTLYYTPILTALSVVAPTNWLTTNAPDLYLYACALEGAKHIKDSEEIESLSAMLPAILTSVQSFSRRRGLPTNGSLRVMPPGVMGRR